MYVHTCQRPPPPTTTSTTNAATTTTTLRYTRTHACVRVCVRARVEIGRRTITRAGHTPRPLQPTDDAGGQPPSAKPPQVASSSTPTAPPSHDCRTDVSSQAVQSEHDPLIRARTSARPFRSGSFRPMGPTGTRGGERPGCQCTCCCDVRWAGLTGLTGQMNMFRRVSGKSRRPRWRLYASKSGSDTHTQYYNIKLSWREVI